MKKLVLCCGLLVSLFLTGCWDKTELSEMFLVSAVALDRNEDDTIHVTVEALEIKSQDEAGNPTGVYFSADGETVADAVENIYHSTEKVLFWAHNQAVIIGEAAAQDSIQKYLDYFSMENDMSADTYLLIAKGKASDLLQEDVEGGAAIGMAIGDIISPQGRRGNSVVVPVTLLDHNRQMLTAGLAPAVPLVSLRETGKEEAGEAENGPETSRPAATSMNTQGNEQQGGESQDSAASQKPEIYISGMAVLDGDRMVGEIGQTAVDGLIWCNNDVHGSIVVVPGVLGEGKLAMEVISSKCEIQFAQQQQKVKATIKLNVEVGVSEQADFTDLTQPNKITQLERLLNQTIAAQIEGTMAKSEELKCDILGVGEACFRQEPAIWKRYKEEKYPYGFDMHVEVSSHIVSLGNVKPPQAIKKEGGELVAPQS